MPKYLPIFILSFFLSHQLLAQGAFIQIRGKVVEAESGSPIGFATVMANDKDSGKNLGGTTTKEDGSFTFSASSPAFFLVFSFIGFEKDTLRDVDIERGRVDLGQISMRKKDLGMDEVVIAGEKSSMEFQLDKRVFNVGQDLSSMGASAFDVLNSVPSVNVNIEGEISLRGAGGVQILINGKPSVLASEQGNALGTITAGMIEKVEVITNPSAKYEAEGSSGIINIVLKKEERKGLNGSMTLNTGIPHNHSLGLSLNRRTEKFNLFSQFGVGYRQLPNQVDNINQNLITNTTIISSGEEFRNENYYNIILGTDYHINEYNVITLSGNFAYEIEDQPSETNFRLLDEEDNLISQWRREETTEATNPKWQYELQYKRDFKDDEDHDLLLSALGNFFGKDLSSEFQNTSIIGDNFSGRQRTQTNFQEAKYTFKLDYTKPFTEHITMETGAQYVLNGVCNDFSVSNLVNEEFIPDPNLTNIFDYQQNVLGVYGTGAYEGEKWGIKLGLRGENTDLTTLLLTTQEGNNQNFTNFFPTAHTSFSFSERFSVQAGYSKRIYRPRLWDLNPFFNIRNNFSVRTGNPNLLPEYTDSYEVTSIYVWDKASLNLSIFHRYTTDVIERVSFFENDVNTTQPVNLGTNRSTGVEVNGKIDPAKWISIRGDFNFLYFDREGSLESQNFDFRASQSSGNLTGKLKLPANVAFELTGQYRSGFETVQGKVSRQIFGDLGLRMKILKGRGVINFSVRDIFASRIRESEAFQEDFYLYSRRLRGRFITLGFSYGFGKGEAMEFGGKRW